MRQEKSYDTIPNFTAARNARSKKGCNEANPQSSTADLPELPAAHAAGRRSRGPPTCLGLPSGPRKRGRAASMPERGGGDAVVHAQLQPMSPRLTIHHPGRLHAAPPRGLQPGLQKSARPSQLTVVHGARCARTVPALVWRVLRPSRVGRP